MWCLLGVYSGSLGGGELNANYGARFHHRSHALRGNIAPDAPRPVRDAERRRLHSHAEHGNDKI